MIPEPEAVERNQAALLLAMGSVGGGEQREEASIAWSIGGSPIAYHNCVVRAELAPQCADQEIVASRKLMQAKGIPGSWHVGPSARPADLAERLQRRGFEGGPEPGMARRLDDPLPAWPSPEGLTVERVREEEGLQAFAGVLSQGFGEGEKEARWVQSVYRKIGLGDEVLWRHYVARLDGVPAGTATLFVHPREAACSVGGI